MRSAHSSAGSETSGLPSGIRAILDAIGPDLRGDRTDHDTQPTNLDQIAALGLITALALLMVVAGQGAGRRGEDIAPLLFWSGVVLLVFPAAFRISSQQVARRERIVLLFFLAGGLFYYKDVYSPTSFSEHDEFLHWIATNDLITAKRLFLSNPLLPVGPDYPALEILTSAFAEVTGLPLFVAAMLLLAVLRAVFIGALFLFYEKIAGSARCAAIACLVYMGCSTFVGFDAGFAYESLGVVFCMVSFALDAGSKDVDEGARLRSAGIIILLLMALTVTHHLSSAYAAIYFTGMAILETARRGSSRREASIAIGIALFLAIMAVALPLTWIWARGDSLAGYLGPAIENGLKALVARFHNLSLVPETNQFAIPSQPLAIRLTTLLGVLLLALGLATGFFRALAMAMPTGAATGWQSLRGFFDRRWRESRIVFLAFLAFGFPISTAFRLTVAGWEIGNRMGTFVFLGVGFVVAVSIVHFWQPRAPRDWRWILLPALALGIIVMGGVTAASVKPIRGPYRAGADADSIEPMAIQTARWTKDWLGPGNRFVADRVNRLLLGSYGRQQVKMNVNSGVDASLIYEPEKLSADELFALAKSNVDFLLVDMRLSRFPAVFGYYFEPWESSHGAPLSPKALLKFDKVDGVARVYDNGWMKIYDVRGLHGRF